jgi:hypothetical protein
MFDNTRRLPASRLVERQAWAAAEFLDVPCTNEAFLTALVCHVRSRWQWSISYLDGKDRGELISIGMANDLAEAREMTICELAKWLLPQNVTVAFELPSE